MERFVVKYEDALSWFDAAVNKKRTEVSDWGMARNSLKMAIDNLEGEESEKAKTARLMIGAAMVYLGMEQL